MACFYRTTVEDFLAQSEEHVLARMGIAYANRGYTSQYSDQTLTWERDIRSLRKSLTQCVAHSITANLWGILLEFSIPRKELRIDAVVLIRNTIVILEAKTGDTASQAKRQIEEYALLLHYFHKGSTGRRIVPILVSPESNEPDLMSLNQRELFPQLASYWVAPTTRSSWCQLSNLLLELEDCDELQADAETWDGSPYFPVPSIIEAALALKSGLSIREIAHSEASEHEIEFVGQAIQEYVDRARADSHHAICFLTGVPGSGKTLVGLSLAHSVENKASAIHFMSGNGPLVQVLQYLFTQESMRTGAKAPQARTEAKTLIENVHVFARYYTEDQSGPPSNHAIIFDEAQRAWNRAQNLKKFRRDYSEPEMLLRIMERHADWAVVVALVGGGQEINDGEAGLEEWGRALSGSVKPWKIYASPEVLNGGPSTAGHKLFEDPSQRKEVQTNLALHLRTSNRSLRADQLATWVNFVIDGKAEEAASLGIPTRFPIFMSRNLVETRSKLRKQGIGASRYGLVGSSGAARLRSEGLEPSSSFHAEYPWEHWYLADASDVRSSFRCEVFATEFEIQGLELDWIGLCWGGDFVWDTLLGWQTRRLLSGPPSRWTPIKNAEKQVFRRNAYRVLLTRARQGMIIFVPSGNPGDPTNMPDEFEATAQYLLRCGVTPLK
ncbi:MAG: DNA/RNA helicase domain-containing protein [Acidobacteriaceae bacterium]